MGPVYYIGLDVHKQKISYCVKTAARFLPGDVSKFFATAECADYHAHLDFPD